MGIQLTTDERNLFSLACKNSVSSRRASIRILSSIENKENQKDVDENHEKRLAIIRFVVVFCFCFCFFLCFCLSFFFFVLFLFFLFPSLLFTNLPPSLQRLPNKS